MNELKTDQHIGRQKLECIYYIFYNTINIKYFYICIDTFLREQIKEMDIKYS